MPLIRSLTSWDDLVRAPSVESVKGPVCMTCGKIVDSEDLVEGYPGVTTYAKVLVKHHGGEELRTFNMGSSNWDEQDLGSMMRRTNWFDPTRHEGLGLGNRVDKPADHDGGDTDDVKVTPMIVVP